VRRIGQVVYGVSAVSLGVLILIAGDLGAVFQPVPRWAPAWLGLGLAYASAALLIAGGFGLLARTTTRLATRMLAVDFLVWLLFLNVPSTVAKPTLVGNWEGCGLNMAAAAGSLTLLALSSPPSVGRARHLFGDSGVKLARRLFAAGLPLIGVAHFADAQDAANEYVPSWLPLRIGWVYLTGAGHVAAGLAIFFGALPVLASVLEAGQITAFIVLAHLPAVYGAPHDRGQWAQLAYAAVIAGSAWLVAATARLEARL
jgi:uncharacterized membrane protein